MEDQRQRVQAQLVKLMMSTSPNQAGNEGNIPSPSSLLKSGREGHPESNIELSRDDSLNALSTLVRESSIDRQRSLDRLPSIELCGAYQTSQRLWWIVSRVQTKMRLQDRFRRLREYRLRRRLANATGVAECRLSSQEQTVAAGVHKEQERQSREKSDSFLQGPQVLNKMIGHDLPYGWQLSHELMLDDQFEFSPDGLVLPDPVHRQFVHLFLKACEAQQAQELANALTRIVKDTDTIDEDVRVVDKTLRQIREVLASMHGTDLSSDFDLLNSQYLCQMLRHHSVDTEYLTKLIQFVCEQASIHSIIQSPPILEWAQKVPERLEGATDSQLSTASVLLYEMLAELKSMRACEMNMRLTHYRPAFQQIGAEFEASQVTMALANGQLALDRTAIWMDAAWQSVAPVPSSTNFKSMVQAHREGIRLLLERLSLENKKRLKPSTLPEILALDTHRLSTFRGEIRQLSVTAAIHTLCIGILKAAGVELSASERAGLKSEILVGLGLASSSQVLCTTCVQLIQDRAGGNSKKLPRKQQLMAALKDASTNRQPSSLRGLYTKRITAAVTIGTLGNETPHGSLSMITQEIQELAGKVSKWCTYLEQAYGQLYIGLILSQSSCSHTGIVHTSSDSHVS